MYRRRCSFVCICGKGYNVRIHHDSLSKRTCSIAAVEGSQCRKVQERQDRHYQRRHIFHLGPSNESPEYKGDRSTRGVTV